jgi:hypothetical protein
MTMRFVGVAALAALPACGSYAPPPPSPGPTPTPTPDTSAMVVPGAGTGPTRITFVDAQPMPGSTLSGCGPRITGCAGGVRMTFNVQSAVGGHVLFMRAYLHDTRKIACLTASTGPFDLGAGQTSAVELVFDQADDVCGTPLTIANMDAGVEGTVEIASRQEWAVRYGFAP